MSNHRRLYEQKMQKQGVEVEHISSPEDAKESPSVQERVLQAKLKQHQNTAQEEGLNPAPVRSKSSRRITPHLSQRLGNDLGDPGGKRRYYMRKGLFNGIGGNTKKRSVPKTERVSQNSQNVSSKHGGKNGANSFRPIIGSVSQDGQSGIAVKGPRNKASLANSSILR